MDLFSKDEVNKICWQPNLTAERGVVGFKIEEDSHLQ